MKKGPSGTEKEKSERRARVTWDETNLMENEILQAELNPMKIDEPKTPYRSPLCTDEESELDEEASKSAVDQADEDVIPQESLARPYELRDDTRRRRSVDEYYNTGNIPEDEMLGEEDDLEEQEDEEAKKKQFLEARKMHYKISKNILSNPVESDEDDEGNTSNEMMH